MGRKIAFITGGRRGIGRSIAYALAGSGFDIVLNDWIEDDAAAETIEGVRARGARISFLCGDISEAGAHEALAEAAFAAFGTVDCLVNNAGIQVKRRGDIFEVTPEGLQAVLATNLHGVFFLTQAIARRMLAQERPPHERTIITITSANAEMASIDKTEYCISKAALSMVTKLFAVRLADAGICVFEIRPGLIKTDMTRDVREKYSSMIEQGLSPIARWGEPEEVARAVATLAEGRMPFTTGYALNIDGGMQIPRL